MTKFSKQKVLKNPTINPKSCAHLKTIRKKSAKFQIDS